MLRTVLSWCLWLMLAAACTSHNRPSSGSESHFLADCEASAECGEGLACIDRVCSRTCVDDQLCDALAATAACRPSTSSAATQRACDVSCDSVADCSALGDAFICATGRCREELAGAPVEHDASIDGGPPGVVSGSPIEVAFKAGFFDDEQLWVRLENGELRKVSEGQADPRRAQSCDYSFLSGGYIENGGRFANLTFDPSGRYLLFAESVACTGDFGQLVRVMAYDGVSDSVQEVLGESAVEMLGEGGVALLNVLSEGSRAGQLYEFSAGVLSPIAVPSGGVPLRVLYRLHAVRFNGASLLFRAELPALLKRDGVWQTTTLLDGLAESEIRYVTASPSEALLCGLASDADDSTRTFGFVVSEDWGLRTIPMEIADPVFLANCAFSDDERQVAFEDQLVSITVDGLEPAGTASDGFRVAGFSSGAFYGVRDKDVLRVDQTTLRSVVVFSAGDLCPEPAEAQEARLLFPPDGRRGIGVAVLKQSCGCEDCDVSASLALQLDTGTAAPIEMPWAGHEVYDVAWPVRGGVQVFSTQAQYPDGIVQGEPDRMPGAGSFFAVDPSGLVGTVGPMPGVEGVVHGPVAPPPR